MKESNEAFPTHCALGYGIIFLALVLTIIAALARMPGRLIGMTGLVAGLGVVQPLIRALAVAFDDMGGTSTTAGQLIFGLHAINGLTIGAGHDRCPAGREPCRDHR